ncbi:hypothetical protein M427DRAFT_73449 [Gonapodya prolifera JEL478]|uniref:CST complex subunit CTC1 n=1 Tax=Gonapodya prolifera (strain JEL478) TaxID=1344416 RepID=A0A139A2X6_GONPJ|nr:hypothetical protein M427DRAFT_73449 [Gonapodya prolifera JEL478]|eukprot:KXS10865.1 hypothetical protein M427DRAFT_73449 [Gonapodya prolifera JEL478]
MSDGSRGLDEASLRFFRISTISSLSSLPPIPQDHATAKPGAPDDPIPILLVTLHAGWPLSQPLHLRKATDSFFLSDRTGAIRCHFGQGAPQTRHALVELVFSGCTSGDDAGKRDSLDITADSPSTSATVVHDAKSLMKYTQSPWSGAPLCVPSFTYVPDAVASAAVGVPGNARPKPSPATLHSGLLVISDTPFPVPRHHPLNKIHSYHFNSDDFDPLSNTPEARGWTADLEKFPHLHAATLLGALRPVNQYLEGSASRDKAPFSNGAMDPESPLLPVPTLVDPAVRTFTRTMLPRLTSVTLRGVVSAKSPIIRGRSSGGVFFLNVRYGEQNRSAVDVASTNVDTKETNGPATTPEELEKKGIQASTHPSEVFAGASFFSTNLVFKLAHPHSFHAILRVGGEYVFSDFAVKQMGNQRVAAFVDGKSRVWTVVSPENSERREAEGGGGAAVPSSRMVRGHELLEQFGRKLEVAGAISDSTTFLISYTGTVSQLPSNLLTGRLLILDDELELHFHQQILPPLDLARGCLLECRNVHLTRTVEGKAILVACVRSTVEVKALAGLGPRVPVPTTNQIQYPVLVSMAQIASPLDVVHFHVLHCDLRRKGLTRYLSRSDLFGSSDPPFDGLLVALAKRWAPHGGTHAPAPDAFASFLDHSKCTAVRIGFELRRMPTISAVLRHQLVTEASLGEDYGVKSFRPSDLNMDRAVIVGRLDVSTKAHFVLIDGTGTIPLIIDRAPMSPLSGFFDPRARGGIWMIERWEVVVERVEPGGSVVWIQCSQEDIVCLVTVDSLQTKEVEPREGSADPTEVLAAESASTIMEEPAQPRRGVSLLIKITHISLPKLFDVTENSVEYRAQCEGVVSFDDIEGATPGETADVTGNLAHVFFAGEAAKYMAFIEVGRCYRFRGVTMREVPGVPGEIIADAEELFNLDILSKSGFATLHSDESGEQLQLESHDSDDAVSLLTQDHEMTIEDANLCVEPSTSVPTSTLGTERGVVLDLLGHVTFNLQWQSSLSPTFPMLHVTYPSHAAELTSIQDILNSGDANSGKFAPHGYLERLVSFQGVVVAKEFRDGESSGMSWLSYASHKVRHSAADVFRNYGVGTGKAGRVLYLRIRDLRGLDVLDFYWDIGVTAWPLGLLRGSIVRIWQSARKASKGGRSVYCVSLSCTSVEVCGQSKATSGPLSSWNGQLGEIPFAYLASLPAYYLCELLEVDTMNLRTYVRIECRIIALAEVSFRFACEVCGMAFRDRRCINSCGSGRGRFTSEARAVVEDGTGEAHVYFEGAKAVFSLLRVTQGLENYFQDISSKNGDLWYRNLDFYSTGDDDDIFGDTLVSQDVSGEDALLRTLCRDASIFRDVVVYGKRYRREGDEKYPRRTIKFNSGDAPLETLSLARLIVKAVALEDIDIGIEVARHFPND